MKRCICTVLAGLLAWGTSFAADNLDAGLLKAIRSDDVGKVRSLLSMGADPNAADFKGAQPAYEIAVLSGYYKIATLLAKSGADTRGITPLMLAARKGDSQPLAQVINEKAKATSKDAEGNTALMYAVLADSISCVKLLLQHGCSVNETNNSGATPLFTAQSSGMVHFLCKHGAEINVKDDYDETPLFTFVTKGSIDLVKTALSLGADPNVVDRGGRSALGWLAAECERGNSSPDYLKIKALLKSIGAKEIGKDAEG